MTVSTTPKMMIGKTMTTIFQQFQCDYCGAVKMVDAGVELQPAMMVSQTFVPPDWQWVGRKLVCPRHDVLVTNKPDWSI